MNTQELAEATKEFDDPDYDPPVLPWTEEDTARHERARRRGRPRNGLGAKTIALTVERGLLERSDRFARRKGISRAQLVALALRAVLSGKVKVPSASGAKSASRPSRRSKAA
jgi:hypothetical protein